MQATADAARPDLSASMAYGMLYGMKAARKVTLVLPEQLLADAQEVTQLGVTATIRRGLELLAADKAYVGLAKLRGKLKLKINIPALRADR